MQLQLLAGSRLLLRGTNRSAFEKGPDARIFAMRGKVRPTAIIRRHQLSELASTVSLVE